MTREDLIDAMAQEDTNHASQKELTRLYYDNSYDYFDGLDDDEVLEIAKDFGVITDGFTEFE